MSLDGKVALVTGASSGIGEATALTLAKHGVKVTLVARRQDRLDDLEQRIKTAGGDALSVVADVAWAADCARSVSETKDKWGRLDILVNNAGVMYLGSVADANPEDWERMVNINVLGLMYCTHYALPIMKAQGSGHIVNISSVAGRQTRDRSAVYSATKFAVGAFSDGLRQEVTKSNIRVTVIEPGAVLTELTDHIPGADLKKTVKDWVDSMEALTSDDIAQSILYAVSQPRRVNVNEILIRPTDQV